MGRPVDISVVSLNLVGVQIVYLQPFFTSLLAFYDTFDTLNSTFQIWTQRLISSLSTTPESPISSSCVSSEVPPLSPSFIESPSRPQPLRPASSDLASFADLPQKPQRKFYFDISMDDVAVLLPKQECSDGRFLFVSFGKFRIENHRSRFGGDVKDFPIWMERVSIRLEKFKVKG